MRPMRGFTLLEMLVSLVLLGGIMLGLLSAMRTLAASSASVETVADRIGEMEAVTAFLRTTIRGLEDAGVITEASSGGFERVFQGESGRLRWAGVMSASHEEGGLHVFEIEAGRGMDGARALLLHYQSYPGTGSTLMNAFRRTHLLVHGIEMIGFAYQGDDPVTEWLEHWDEQEARQRLPSRIRVRIKVAGRYWPDIVVPVKPL
jgi:prepilin-type N-terminal cleavage/methylation domain-containing protein